MDNRAVISVFPEPSDVFADPVAARHLLPLLTVDLAAVNPEWRGVAHVVSPVEPMDGYVGETTEDTHTYTCRANWLGFRVDEDGRYHFLADWRYFPDPVAEFHDRVHADYQHRKSLYREHGALLETRWLDRQPLEDALAHPLALLTRVGGTTPGWPNWTGGTDFPLATDDPDDVHPVAEDGTRFHHVASTTGWHWRMDGADGVVMFFEPASRTVLFTFDWS